MIEKEDGQRVLKEGECWDKRWRERGERRSERETEWTK